MSKERIDNSSGKKQVAYSDVTVAGTNQQQQGPLLEYSGQISVDQVIPDISRLRQFRPTDGVSSDSNRSYRTGKR